MLQVRQCGPSWPPVSQKARWLPGRLPGPCWELGGGGCSPLALGTSWGMLGRPQLGGFLWLHTHLSVHSFMLKGQRLACLNLSLSGAGFGLLWDHSDFLRPGFLGHHSQLDRRVAFNRTHGPGSCFLSLSVPKL